MDEIDEIDEIDEVYGMPPCSIFFAEWNWKIGEGQFVKVPS